MRARIGVIGTGWWATRAHLPALAANRDAAIAAIADPDRSNRERARRHFNIAPAGVFDDVNAMLERASLDGVIVAVPHHLHATVAEAALERGLHTLVEKPMTLRSVDAHRLGRLAQRRGCELIVGYPWHYNRQVIALRALIAAGRIGRLEAVTAQYASIARELYRGAPERYADLLDARVNAPGADTYSDPAISGGGQAVTQTTHVLALLLWLTGLRPRHVAAMVGRFDLDVDLVDGVLIAFEGDAIASVASTGSLLPGQDERLEVRLFGTGGHVLLDLTAGRAAVIDTKGTVEELPLLAEVERTPEGAPSANLVDVILGRAPNGSPASVGIGTVELVEAVYAAAETGRTVDITSTAGA